MMTNLFNWADQIKPRTKKIVIGLVLFGIFVAILPENRPRPTRVSTPVTTPSSTTNSNFPTAEPSKDLLADSSVISPSLNSPGSVFSPNSLTASNNNDLRSTGSIASSKTIDILATRKIEASFDCTKAQTGIETLVCADADLATLDKKVADKYFEKLLKAPKENAEGIKSDQRDFLKFRVSACQVPPVISGTPVDKFIPCLMNIYSQRLISFGQPATKATTDNIPIENELPWLKEKRLKGDVDYHDELNENQTEAPAKPIFNQQDFDACMDGEISRCHFETMNPQQQAVVVAGFHRNYSSCLNGLSYSCNKGLLAPDQLEKVHQSDLRRNYSSCINGLSYSCNKALLTTEQQVAVNRSDMQRNLNACYNGLSYQCNKDWLSSDQRAEANRKDLERNFNACMNGLTYMCNRKLLSTEELSKINRQ